MYTYKTRVIVDTEKPTLTYKSTFVTRCTNCTTRYRVQADFVHYSERMRIDVGFTTVCPVCDNRDNQRKEHYVKQ